MNQQISNIIIATMICGTALYGLGAFETKEMTYATVQFDGGFKKIGEILDQRTFSKVTISLDDETVFSGDIEKVTSDLQKSLNKKKNPELVTFNNGVKIEGNIGIKWIGSEGSFELTFSPIDLVSKDDSPLNIEETIKLLQKKNNDMMAKHMEFAKKALIFSERPKSSFLLSKLSSALRS